MALRWHDLVVPDEVRLSVDLRHATDAGLDGMEQELEAACGHIGNDTGTVIGIEVNSRFAACRFDDACIDAVCAAAERLGLRHLDIVSGAGHDAVYLARVAPTGMIFVPCEHGILHNEIENATPEDLAAGADVLLQAMVQHAA